MKYFLILSVLLSTSLRSEVSDDQKPYYISEKDQRRFSELVQQHSNISRIQCPTNEQCQITISKASFIKLDRKQTEEMRAILKRSGAGFHGERNNPSYSYSDFSLEDNMYLFRMGPSIKTQPASRPQSKSENSTH